MSSASAQAPRGARSVGVIQEVLAGLISLATWFALLIAGSFIGTEPERAKLAGDGPLVEKVLALAVILFCYTGTNIALLCCLASVMGGLFRRQREEARGRTETTLFPVLILSMVFQGFLIYLVIVAGVIAFGGWRGFVSEPQQDQYIRLAATASLISFMVGYSPSLFNNLLRRLERWLEGRPAKPSR